MPQIAIREAACDRGKTPEGGRFAAAVVPVSRFVDARWSAETPEGDRFAAAVVPMSPFGDARWSAGIPEGDRFAAAVVSPSGRHEAAVP